MDRLLALVALAGSLAAQAPELRLQPTAKPGQTLDSLVLGQPSQPFATWLDLSGGPRAILGETFYLGLTPALTLLDAGVLNTIGVRTLALATPSNPLLASQPFYAQSLVLDPSASNGTFRMSNGASTILHGAATALALSFDDPGLEGVLGEFDTSVKTRLQAAPVQTRTRNVTPQGGVPFGAALAGPLNPYGTRHQMVYRAIDVAASGESEALTAIRWKPGTPVQPDAFPRIVIKASHSSVVPDYSVDPFSALPRFPLSGLGSGFAQNVKPPQTTVWDGAYAIAPSQQLPDGYMPFPIVPSVFVYNGLDSLLIEMQTPPSATTLGVNGLAGSIMVISSPLPAARAHANGNSGRPVDPFLTTVATGTDNFAYDLQLEFKRLTSAAWTRFMRAPGATFIYRTPVAALALPAGTSVQLLYEGAQNQQGQGATGWTTNMKSLWGLPYIRVQARFAASVTSGAVPSIDTLVIPID